MTSFERHEARYQRRKAKREQKRKEFYKRYDDINIVASMKNISRASRRARRGVNWKPSVQRYMSNELHNNTEIRRKMLSGEDVRKGFITFDIYERGKKRHIQSVHIGERIAQKALCQSVLHPIMARDLIFDNGACLPGKGTDFAIERLKKHLRDHHRKYGREGYVLLFDFKGYFDSIPHKGVNNILRNRLTDERLLTLAERFVDAFEGYKGLGLGSEICQILAVAYPSPIDHMFKDQCGVHCYARYNDDGYAISDSKEFLIEMREKLFDKAEELGLRINKTKTQIIKLRRGFRFLKARFMLSETGKVIVKPWHKSIVKQRQKLKKFARFVKDGTMTIAQVKTAFFSWLGYISKRNSYRTRKSIIKLFLQLFPGETEVITWKPKKEERWKKTLQQQREERMLMSTA